MFLDRQTCLQSLIWQIAEDCPDGLRHPEFVRKILEIGYDHYDDIPLSKAVHSVLKQLVETGEFIKTENDYGSIEYMPVGSLVSI